MKKHGFFEILTHDDDELAGMHGADVVWRKPLRAWPLSVVERVVFNDGTSRIYKACRSPPVEADFYQKALSRHIPGVFYNHSEGDQHWLLLEDLDGQHPADLSREELFDLARRAREIIDTLNPVESCRYGKFSRPVDSQHREAYAPCGGT